MKFETICHYVQVACAIAIVMLLAMLISTDKKTANQNKQLENVATNRNSTELASIQDATVTDVETIVAATTDEIKEEKDVTIEIRPEFSSELDENELPPIVKDNMDVAEPEIEVKDFGSTNVAEYVEDSSEPCEDNMTYFGSMQMTAYVATGNRCADGSYPEVGWTVACNDSRLWHKKIYIEGYGVRYVHDTGGMASNVLDLFVGSLDEAYSVGRRNVDVYIVEE